jgi:GDSL/SGNH-like Acyl-Esterase family found in Pmr5 and Cas1p
VFIYDNLNRGCYFQEGNEVKMEMNVDTAYQRAIGTLFSWLNAEVNITETQVVIRTYAPVHFRFVPFFFLHLTRIILYLILL